MISARDPASMAVQERRTEVAELVGQAYLRLLLSRKESEKPLAEAAESEPSSHPVNGSEDKRKEVR